MEVATVVIAGVVCLLIFDAESQHLNYMVKVAIYTSWLTTSLTL